MVFKKPFQSALKARSGKDFPHVLLIFLNNSRTDLYALVVPALYSSKLKYASSSLLFRSALFASEALSVAIFCIFCICVVVIRSTISYRAKVVSGGQTSGILYPGANSIPKLKKNLLWEFELFRGQWILSPSLIDKFYACKRS